VLPFSVPGSGSFAYLAQGMVDLLSRNLNGAEALVTVDPGRVISATGRGEPGVLDADRGRKIARRLGAGQYILGSVVPAGGQLRIQAQLYQRDSTASPAIAQAVVEGDSAKLFELVDQLAAQLLVRRGQGQGARLAQTAALTTRSLPALKTYLDAERNQMGRDEESLHLLEVAFTGTPNELHYRAPTHLLRAQALQRLNKWAAATEQYSRFVKLWASCNPALRPVVEGAKAELAALTAEPR
jgi:hypothetical protein